MCLYRVSAHARVASAPSWPSLYALVHVHACTYMYTHPYTLTQIHIQAVLSVFDGHGGNEVAEHCRESLHRHFAYQLSLQRTTTTGDGEDDDTPYHHHHIAEALRASFLCTDSELKGTEAGDYVGATAVVAVVGKSHIIIAHAGASIRFYRLVASAQGV